MTKPVNWGILGAAKFARRHMAPSIHASRDARLFALATSHPDKAAPFRAINPDIRVHQSYDALLADPQVDAVYIPLPNHLHVEWTKRALAAGKHVLTEKPIALAAGEIDGLIAQRDETGLLAAEAYMIVHHPQWIRARALIANGAIGALQHAEAVFTYDNRTQPQNIRNRPETGGGAIRDIGVYTCSALRFVASAEPETLTARLRWEHGVDVWAQVTGEMKGPGSSFTFSTLTSMRMSARQEVLLHGERGTLRLTAPFNPATYGLAELILRHADGREEIERWPGVNQYVLQVENFCQALRTGEAYPCPLEFSRAGQAMLDQIYATARETG